MASGTEMGRRAGRALADAKDRLGRRAGALRTDASELAADVRTRIDESRAKAGPEGWGLARFAAGAAGALLLWRAMFGRGLARIPAAVAGFLVLRAALRGTAAAAGRTASAAAVAGGGARQGGPEVIEAKSPAELERGTASESPKPTFPSRVDLGGPDPDVPPDRDRRH